MYDWAEFRHFRYLLAILERQGFRAAADQLFTTQPNLSIQARQFQETVSVQLFHKSKSGRIRPTESGRAFIALARLLLETRDEVIDALIEIDRGKLRQLRFGCSPQVNPDLYRSAVEFHRELVPSCSIHPMYGDTQQLADEVAQGSLDAALITLPLQHDALKIQEIHSDRLVVCIRKTDPLATRFALSPGDLKDRLPILYDPQRHPSAHARLLELLYEVGLSFDQYARGSTLSDMLMLVKDGYGFTMLREGTSIDPDLITRPIAGVGWTVDTALIYHHDRHPKTVPILAKKLRSLLKHSPKRVNMATLVPATNAGETGDSSSERAKSLPVQLELLDGMH